MSSNLITRPLKNRTLHTMLIKKYKILKSKSTLLNLNKIVKKSSFFCFAQIKQLNHNEWLFLKQLVYPLGLNILVCKNTFLKRKNVLLNSNKNLWNSLSYGNVVIIYCFKNITSFSTKKFFSLDFLQKRMIISPLIFYFLGRFLFFKDFLENSNNLKNESFSNFIYILEQCSLSIPNKLILANKCLLSCLETKKL